MTLPGPPLGSPTDARPLLGRYALVTGGSRGLGRAIVLALAKAGACVHFSYLSQKQAAEDLVRQIREAGGEAFCHPLDQAVSRQVHQLMDTLHQHCTALHILVNNAGMNRPCDFDQIREDDWDQILAVNLKGPFLVTQSAWPLLCQAAAASVIFIGSVSGQYGGPRTAHYAASKAGLISLAQVVARFGAGRGIRSNVVAAGLIASPMAQGALAAPQVASQQQSILLGRLGTPEEVAQAVLFLASDHSSYVTAQTLNVNGGLYF
jgi:3-oxoacyl-[acyl-carrier protein] reductase